MRVWEERIAAPKTLEPEETPSFVRGTMSCSRVLRSADSNSWGVLDDILSDAEIYDETYSRSEVGLNSRGIERFKYGFLSDSSIGAGYPAGDIP